MLKGKYVRIDPENPTSVAICDASGLPCNYTNLRKQMKYTATGVLIWTGLLVNKKFLTRPNPQDGSPRLTPDPVPLVNTRPGGDWDDDSPIVIEKDDETLWFLNAGVEAGTAGYAIRTVNWRS